MRHNETERAPGKSNVIFPPSHSCEGEGKKKTSRETALDLKEPVIVLGINARFGHSTAELQSSLIIRQEGERAWVTYPPS